MSVFIVGTSEPSGALTAALVAAGVEAELHSVGATGERSGEALAAALVALERLVEGGRPQAIVAVGSGDSTTAAALVATKSEIPLIALLAEPSNSLSGESSAVAELSSRTLQIPADGPAVQNAAAEIARILLPSSG